MPTTKTLVYSMIIITQSRGCTATGLYITMQKKSQPSPWDPTDRMFWLAIVLGRLLETNCCWQGNVLHKRSNRWTRNGTYPRELLKMGNYMQRAAWIRSQRFSWTLKLTKINNMIACRKKFVEWLRWCRNKMIKSSTVLLRRIRLRVDFVTMINRRKRCTPIRYSLDKYYS